MAYFKPLLLVVFAIIIFLPVYEVYGANPNLSVSAENSKFENHFSGSMVIEVVIRNSDINDTDEGKGEPDVTINGKSLRMVQAADGNWYAYFANVDKAKIADSTVGLAGEGLDFGVFCGKKTTSLGIDITETEGIAIPRSGGLSGFTNGDVSFSSCTGTLSSSQNQNNVVRKAKSINTNSNVLPGQIGLDPDAWPMIQLYSFSDVTIQYNPAGPSQQVNLEYDEIPNITLDLDRDTYPQNSEVFLTLSDYQLNQDPTDEDSWTFNIQSPISLFYQAYDNSGRSSANGNAGLVNLRSHLSSLGFEDNGILEIDLGNVMELKTNGEQPNSIVSNGAGTTYTNIVTIVEEGPFSGIFDNADDNDKSNIGILRNAPRGETATIEYNEESISVLTGFSTASVSLDKPSLTIGGGTSTLRPGTEVPIVLVDPDQNINSGSRDDLDVFRETSIIPTLEIGNPVTLENASNVKIFTSSSDNLLTDGNSASSSLLDKNSKRLFIDTSGVPNGDFEKISLNLGISSSNLQSVLIDPSQPNSFGTNWLNYDLQSFSNDFGISDFSDSSIDLYFGSLSSSPVTIVESGQMSSNGFIQLDDSVVESIFSKSGSVFIVINFDSSNNNSGVGEISNETNKQPIILDFFSFGLVDNNDINNSIYRFELEETTDNSSTFDGTIEYAVTNQLNILDPIFIGTITTIDDEIKFIVTDRLVDEEGISINYSDLADVGVIITTSAKSDIATSSGKISLDASTIRFGQPVTFTLSDSDLNLKSDTIETYLVNNDPFSPNVDTVGKDGNILLEILIKDIRFKRCTINGVETGGLGATGFSLVETEKDSGIFKGVFKMPSQMCNKSGTALISTAGGSLDARYFDARDEFGEPNIFRLSSVQQTTSSSSSLIPTLSENEIILPSTGQIKEISLTGKISNHRVGIPLQIELINPDGFTQKFTASLSNLGNYNTIFSINEKSLVGEYKLKLSHNGQPSGTVSFFVFNQNVPDWVKNNAKWWSLDQITDLEFIDGLEELIDTGVIRVSSTESIGFEQNIPYWIKVNAKWWANNQISDGDFISAIEYLIREGIIRI